MTRHFGLDHIPRPHIPTTFGIPRREKWICRMLFVFSGIAFASAVLAIGKWWPMLCL